MNSFFKQLIKFLIFLICISGRLFAFECSKNSNIKVGLINDDYINYYYYLTYELDKYSINNLITSDLEFTNIDDYSKFDIVFGDYNTINKLPKLKTSYPDVINNFYDNNNISLSGNIFPLDLDTLILVSKEELDQFSLEELAAYYDTSKYTLGMNYLSQTNRFKITNHNLNDEGFNLKSIFTEKYLLLLKKIYLNSNNNLFNSSFDEVYASFEDNENTFTLFDDGILLNKNFNYSSFQLFPISKYRWNNDKGYYENNIDLKPISYFGFSAYLNNLNEFGFLCHLIDGENRLNAFRKFNLQISPLSNNEVEFLKDEIDLNYYEILKYKNKYISKYDIKDYEEIDNFIIDVIFKDIDYNNLLNVKYLED